MIETFTFLPLERVVYGPGSIAALPDELERLGAQRVLIISGRTVAEETPIVRNIVALLGERHAATVKGVGQHAPLGDVQRAAALAQEVGADLLLSAGGGSAIDAAKAERGHFQRSRLLLGFLLEISPGLEAAVVGHEDK